MAATPEVQEFLDSLPPVLDALNASIAITNARDAIRNNLDQGLVSTEEQMRVLVDFEVKIALGINELGITLIQNAATSKYAAEQAKAQAELIGVQKAQAETEKEVSELKKLELEASLRKQYGLTVRGNVLTDHGDGLVDEQTKGFVADRYHKMHQTISGENGMLAQNDTEVPSWMVDTEKITMAIMSDRHIEFYKEGGDTKVRWKATPLTGDITF